MDKELLKLLNPQQLKAVIAPAGPVLVLAGPGSGKTRVLTYRIAYLIGAMNVPAYNILAVTFTNKAAREMAARVDKIIADHAGGMWLGTFHAICGRILRREADLLPIDQNYVIFDENDQKTLIKQLLKEANADEKVYRPSAVLDAISRAKNDLQKPDDFPISNFRDEKIKQFYSSYQQLLVRNNAMDFDDMLLYTADLLENSPIIRDKYAHKFEHILVDEFQDTNLAQYMILYHLASRHHNLYVVGDEDQSIYRWRGADYRNIQRFEKDFKGSQKILLEQNYRSTQTILDGAMAVVDQNQNRTKKKLFTHLPQGKKITLYEALDDHDEAAYVVTSINRLINHQKNKPSDFAIMYRTNAQSRLLEEEFRRAGLNYRLVGAQRFYGRREVKDAIAFLRLVHNPKDEVSLMRTINLPPRGIGAKTIEKLFEYAVSINSFSGEILMDLAKGDQSVHWLALGREAYRLSEFGKMLADWHLMVEEGSLSDLFDLILSNIEYHDYINDRSEEGQDRWENIMEFRQVLVEYESEGMAEFLAAMALVADQDTLPEVADAPTMLTLHASKGLEFEQVFILGLDELLLPHSRSRDDVEALAEERRLFYVGMTRAKKQLTLSRARRRRSNYGSYEETQPSRFLDDIPESLIDGGRRTYRSRLGGSTSLKSGTPRWEVPAYRIPMKNTTPAETRFKAGMHVSHPIYGKGTVKNSRIELGDETVEVNFDSGVLKALVASLANLKILE